MILIKHRLLFATLALLSLSFPATADDSSSASPSAPPHWRADLDPLPGDASVGAAAQCEGPSEHWTSQYGALLAERDKLDATYGAIRADRKALDEKRRELDAEKRAFAAEKSRLAEGEAALMRMKSDIEKLQIERRKNPDAAQRLGYAAENFNRKVTEHNEALHDHATRQGQLRERLARFNASVEALNESGARFGKDASAFATEWQAYSSALNAALERCAKPERH
ncbi:MAG: hypothetical protein JNL33_05220 [Betaproteobacteria bacterium]|nr:hypothetical protein [Betaproteobacteria bacterium]